VTGSAAQIGLIVILLSVNALLAGSEIALISLREAQLARLEQRGGRGRAIARLARDPNAFLATIQIGITLSGFLASATAAVSLADPLLPLLGPLGVAARPIAVALVTLLLTFVTLVVGELAPKRIALQRAEGWVLAAGGIILLLARFSRPVVAVLGRATNLVVRLAGADPTQGRDALTQEEVRDLIATGSLYSPHERRIITGALEATDRILREVLRPRTAIVALRASAPVADGVRTLVESGHSRAPVYTEVIDDADRLVGIMDLVGKHGEVGDHARPVLALPESVSLFAALRRLQAERLSMALVVDEYGGVSGIVTIEDLLEELVGEIHDEYDLDARAAVRTADGVWEVVGQFPLHDLVDLGVAPDLDLDDIEAVTVAGLVHELLGRLPKVGDTVQVGAHDLTVDHVTRRAIDRVIIRPVATPEGRTPEPPEPQR
jgi:putative hemolysin